MTTHLLKYDVPISILLGIVSLASSIALVLGWSPFVQGQTSPIVKVSAMELLDAFDEDPSRATQKYKGSTLVVTGKVASHFVGAHHRTENRVLLGSHREFKIVQAEMEQKWWAQEPLEEGSKVTLVCRSSGWAFGWPFLKGCVVVPVGN